MMRALLPLHALRLSLWRFVFHAVIERICIAEAQWCRESVAASGPRFLGSTHPQEDSRFAWPWAIVLCVLGALCACKPDRATTTQRMSARKLKSTTLHIPLLRQSSESSIDLNNNSATSCSPRPSYSHIPTLTSDACMQTHLLPL